LRLDQFQCFTIHWVWAAIHVRNQPPSRGPFSVLVFELSWAVFTDFGSFMGTLYCSMAFHSTGDARDTMSVSSNFLPHASPSLGQI
jgi:hypothetical protein